VLTTATDVNGIFAVDLFAKENQLLIGDLKKAARFTASLLEEGKAGVVIPRKYADLVRVKGEIPGELEVCDLPDEELAGLQGTNVALITPDAELSTSPDAPLRLIPRRVILGMGFRKGKSYEELRDFAEETLRELGLGREAVCVIASIDVKKEEPGLVSLAADLDVPLQTFSAEELEKSELENWTFAESDRVREHVGTGNVCERAAAAAGAGKILRGKTAKDGMTVCVGMKPVELYWKPEDKPHRNDPKGHLFVVGIGPGNPEGMTGQAAAALESSDTIIGYSVYNDLVKPYYPDKRYLTTPMTGEEARCRMAIEEARAGHTVALICSGDPGVYGMAGLVLELAGNEKEDDRSCGTDIDSGFDIEIVSGVTAALSGAALLGAPLVHDFAVISLSDRLTPWEKIEKRLRAAAEADLCIVLYNPSSKGRREHLHRAAQILMEQVPGSRVCGIADRIGRDGEKTRVMTLGELAEAETDMFSTVFVGNSSTKRLGNRMVTPRGYRSEK
jgi:cobalt-precorrin 5A hydrolase/precorrin-3B C17-methyltransferase